jgi:hypothetical protein
MSMIGRPEWWKSGDYDNLFFQKCVSGADTILEGAKGVLKGVCGWGAAAVGCKIFFKKFKSSWEKQAPKEYYYNYGII